MNIQINSTVKWILLFRNFYWLFFLWLWITIGIHCNCFNWKLTTAVSPLWKSKLQTSQSHFSGPRVVSISFKRMNFSGVLLEHCNLITKRSWLGSNLQPLLCGALPQILEHPESQVTFRPGEEEMWMFVCSCTVTEPRKVKLTWRGRQSNS